MLVFLAGAGKEVPEVPRGVSPGIERTTSRSLGRMRGRYADPSPVGRETVALLGPKRRGAVDDDSRC